MMSNTKPLSLLLIILLLAVAAYFVYDTFRVRTTNERLAAIIHAEDERLLSDELEDYLSDDSVSVRQRAALAVGRIGGERAAELLMNQLGDGSIDVARTAAFALGLTGQKKLAIELLERTLEMPAAITATAVKSAGRLADSSMAEVHTDLVGLLTHPSPDVREAACYALYYAGAKTEAENLIQYIADEPDSLARLAALYTLSRLRISDAQAVYAEFQSDPDPHTRILALRGLGACKNDRATQLLALSLNDSDRRVVAQAVAGLRAQETKTAASFLAKRLNRTVDEKLIIALSAALKALKSDLGVEMATTHIKANLSDNLVAASLDYVAAVQKDRAIALIDSVLYQKPGPLVRVACADAYASVGNNSVVPRLATLFGDEDPMVRGAALSHLLELDSASMSFYLETGLTDPDPVPVVLALNQIGLSKLTKYLPQMKSFMDGGGEVDPDIRRSVIDAVGAMTDSIIRDSATTELVIAGMFDPEYIVRREATRLYKEKVGKDRDNMAAPAATRLDETAIEAALGKYQTNPYAIVTTAHGDITIELYFDVAPLTVMNFIELANDDFYDGLLFHRVVPNFVVQGGDPRGDGWGGPPYYIRCEYSDESYERGTVGIATSGKDTGGSQFFITHSPQPHLDARYTVFGWVVDGMEVVDQIVRQDIIEEITIHEGKI